MKIVILGPAHPYRGGLASIMETMAREYMRRGDEVRIYTFSLQYPSLLFPGKSQTVDTPAPTDLHIERVMNTCNPLNWIRLHLPQESHPFSKSVHSVLLLIFQRQSKDLPALPLQSAPQPFPHNGQT